MSGVAVIQYLLANNPGVLAAVGSANIFAGDAPINQQMPALSVKEISGVPYMDIAQRDPKRLHTERVQVLAQVKGTEGTPAGDGYPQVKELLTLVLAACPNVHGTVNGIQVDSVLPDLEGPDLSDDALALLTQTRDFIVKYVA